MLESCPKVIPRCQNGRIRLASSEIERDSRSEAKLLAGNCLCGDYNDLQKRAQTGGE
jgi:hypothetical protein